MILLIINLPERVYNATCPHCKRSSPVHAYEIDHQVRCINCGNFIYSAKAEKEADPARKRLQIQEALYWKAGSNGKNSQNENGCPGNRRDHGRTQKQTRPD